MRYSILSKILYIPSPLQNALFSEGNTIGLCAVHVSVAGAISTGKLLCNKTEMGEHRELALVEIILYNLAATPGSCQFGTGLFKCFMWH